MGKRMARYQTRTVKAIQDALVRLLADKPLADITISELAREAKVSRSTFYGRFGNVADVYDSLIGEISREMSPLTSQVVCQDGFAAKGVPFCSLVRDAGRFAPVVREARFMEAYLARGDAHEEHDLFAILTDAGYTEAQAKAVCAFQMSGCFSAARASGACADEWAEVRPVIDRFILGGIAACLAARR